MKTFTQSRIFFVALALFITFSLLQGEAEGKYSFKLCYFAVKIIYLFIYLFIYFISYSWTLNRDFDVRAKQNNNNNNYNSNNNDNNSNSSNNNSNNDDDDDNNNNWIHKRPHTKTITVRLPLLYEQLDLFYTYFQLVLVRRVVHPFTPKFFKWLLPAMNLDISTISNKGASQKNKKQNVK